MRVEIYENFVLQDMIYSYEKLSSDQKFRGTGTLQLMMQSLEYVDSCKIGRIAVVKDEAFLIEDISKYKDLEQKEKFVIKGSHINKILDKRVVLSDVTINTNETYETQIRRLVEQNLINTTASRKIPAFALEGARGYTRKPAQAYVFKKDSLAKIVNEICVNSEMGYRVAFDRKAKRFIFQLTESIEKFNVTFSEELRNATNSELQIATGEAFNVCYLDNNGSITEHGAGNGLERVERMVSGSDVGAAMEELNRGKRKESVISDILLTDQFEYEKDWDLGDIVTFEDKKIGFRVQRPILEIMEIYGKTFDLEVIFGERNKIL